MLLIVQTIPETAMIYLNKMADKIMLNLLNIVKWHLNLLEILEDNYSSLNYNTILDKNVIFILIQQILNCQTMGIIVLPLMREKFTTNSIVNSI